MSKNLKCPVCQNYDIIESEDELAVCGSPRCFFMCNREDLARIAAAMELAKTYVWEKEVVHLKHGNGWPAHISNDGISEIVLHEYKAWEDSKAAKKRVMDLFNTKQ